MPIPMTLGSPGAIGSGWKTVQDNAYPVIQGEIDGKWIDFKHLSQVGLNPGEYSKVVTDLFGRQSDWSLDFLRSQGGLHMRQSMSSRYVFQRGTEIVLPGYVMSIESEDGGPYASIEVKVGAYMPDGTISNLNILSLHAVAQTVTGEQYCCVAVTVDTDGYQIGTFSRMSGAEDIIVASGNNADFFVGTRIVYMNPDRIQSLTDPDAQQAQWETNSSSNAVYLFEKEWRRITNQIPRQEASVLNDSILVDLASLGGQYGAVSTDPNQTGSIGAYIMKAELEQLLRQQAKDYFSWFYNDPNYAATPTGTIEAWRGQGLLSQIPPEFRIPLTPSQMNFRTGEDIVRQFTAANQFVSPELHWFLGPSAYQAITTSVIATRPTMYYANPSMNPGDMPYYGMYEGTKLAGFKHVIGDIVVHFHCVRQWDSQMYSTRNNPTLPRTGDKSWHSFLMDLGPIRNMKPKGNTPGSADLGLVDDQAFKIEYLTWHQGEYQNAFRFGTEDMQGKPVNGQVTNFDRISDNRVFHKFGSLLRDSTACLHTYL